MKDTILYGVGRLAGNALIQRLLEFNVTVSNFFMGIGSGGSPKFSGEMALLRKLKHRSIEHPCIFDVGANKGQFLSTVLQALTDARFHVHSFEPSLRTFETLTRTHATDARITLNNTALGKATGETSLFYDEEGSVSASLTKRDMTHCNISCELTERIRIQTLDDYCLANEIKAIDLLKIDVEGHELDVLRGGERMFGNGSIRMVLFEFAEAAVDTRTFVKDFYSFFNRYNMQLNRLTPSGYLAPMPQYKESYEQFRTTMFVATCRQSNIPGSK